MVGGNDGLDWRREAVVKDKGDQSFGVVEDGSVGGRVARGEVECICLEDVDCVCKGPPLQCLCLTCALCEQMWHR